MAAIRWKNGTGASGAGDEVERAITINGLPFTIGQLTPAYGLAAVAAVRGWHLGASS